MSKDDLAYSQQLALVTNAISKYTRISVFEISMKYLAMSDYKKGVGHEYNKPWLVFLLIKISSQAGGNVVMIEKDFHNVLHELEGLQEYLIPSDAEMFLLSMQPVIYQQARKPKDGISHALSSWVRQCNIFGSKDGYDECLRAQIGVGVLSYLVIWHYVLKQVESHSGEGYFELDLVKLILDVKSYVSLGDVVTFFANFGIRYEDLPSYFKGFHETENTSEGYFFDTALKVKPFRITDIGVGVFSKELVLSSFPLLLTRLLKRTKIQNKVGNDVEEYVKSCLEKSGLKFHTENDIKDVYRLNKIQFKKRMIPDFAIDGADIVFVESKAVELSDWLKSSMDRAELERRLKQDVVKGVMQCEVCAELLKSTNEYSDRKFKAIIVTYSDFGFSTFEGVKHVLGVDIEQYVLNECGGKLSIPLEKIIYMALSDFDALLVGVRHGKTTISEFVDGFTSNKTSGGFGAVKESISSLCGPEVYNIGGFMPSAESDFMGRLLGVSSSSERIFIRDLDEALLFQACLMGEVNQRIESIMVDKSWLDKIQPKENPYKYG